MAQDHARRIIAGMAGSALFVAFGMSLFIAASAGAVRAETPKDADFQRYCREKVPNSAYEKRTERWGVVHYCNQRGTLQNIDLGEACRLTTGSPKYRQDGQRVLCTGHGAQAAGPDNATELDLQRYCRETFPNSAYEHRAEKWGITHYCRRPGATGGFTLQTVDLAKACQAQHGTSDYRKVDIRVFCGAGGGAADHGSYKWPATGFVFHGPVKNGKPNGIGWTRIPQTGAIWIANYRDGLPAGPQLESRKGQLRCYTSNIRKMEGLPMTRCAPLRKHLADVPGR